MTLVIENDHESVLSVYVNDFGDNYHRLPSDASSELEKDARKIRRRYKNIFEYMKARAVYNEYMTRLAIKHGGPRIFKIKLKAEIIEDFIPPKPRMKNNKLNKFLLKNRIMLSNVRDIEPDAQKTEEFIRLVYGNQTQPEFEPTAPTEKMMQVMKEQNEEISAKKIKEITDIDYLEEYFRTKNLPDKKESDNEYKYPSISKLLTGKLDKEFMDTTEQDDVIFYKGSYMNRNTVNELQTYQLLNDLGWNSMRLMKNKDVSKKITKIMKEKEKKNKKGDKKHRKADDFVVRMVTDNDYDSFHEFEEDMLNFTAKSVFGG